MNSDYNNTLRVAYNRGYRVTNDGKLINPKGKEVKGYNYDGYKATAIRIEKKRSLFFFHRLAAYQKYGEDIFKADCVRHLNGNSLDNSLCNIAIGTLSDNMMDIPKYVRVRSATIASHSYMMKWNDDDVLRIKDFYNNTKSYKETMSEFGIKSKSSLFYILHKR